MSGYCVRGCAGSGAISGPESCGGSSAVMSAERIDLSAILSRANLMNHPRAGLPGGFAAV